MVEEECTRWMIYPELPPETLRTVHSPANVIVAPTTKFTLNQHYFQTKYFKLHLLLVKNW